ncbi:MAG TPA: hypothetical protein DD670_04710, partial [Planctomycetaceae bacterium]|nr:hypothetical protein [Planctomycetaceae bacterium]
MNEDTRRIMSATDAPDTRRAAEPVVPRFDEATCRTFFERLGAAARGIDGRLPVYRADESGHPIPGTLRFFAPDDIEAIVSHCREHVAELYCGGYLIESELAAELENTNRRGIEPQISWILDLRSHIDAKTDESSRNYPPHERIVATLNAVALRPSLITGCRGGDVDAFWFFTEPLVLPLPCVGVSPAESRDETRKHVANIASQWQGQIGLFLGCDDDMKPYVFDVDDMLNRSFRVPGSWHARRNEPVVILADVGNVEAPGSYRITEFERAICLPPGHEELEDVEDATPRCVARCGVRQQARWRAVEFLSNATTGMCDESVLEHLALVLVCGFGLEIEEAASILAEANALREHPVEDNRLKDMLREANDYRGTRGLLVAGKQSVIAVGPDTNRMADEAIRALTTRSDVFQRAATLVHLVGESAPPKGIAREHDIPTIQIVPNSCVGELLDAVAMWFDLKKGFVRTPAHVTRAVRDRGFWQGIRPLVGVTEVPVLRADGSIVVERGYDDATGLYFAPIGEVPPVPATPSVDDARQAVVDLHEVVVDFPFGNPAHKAAWIASVVTPLARYAFDGPAPLFAVDANTSGCGKGLLITTTGLIASGRRMATTTLPTYDTEMRKRITSIALAGTPLVLVDNIDNVIDLPSFDAALTSTTWSDRILGRSEMANDLPLCSTWYATGNNLSMKSDTVRRTAHIRLETLYE